MNESFSHDAKAAKYRANRSLKTAIVNPLSGTFPRKTIRLSRQIYFWINGLNNGSATAASQLMNIGTMVFPSEISWR